MIPRNWHDCIWHNCITLLVILVVGASTAYAQPGRDVVLINDGKPNAVIHVPPDVMADDAKNAASLKNSARELELQRQRLRESVKDLSAYLRKMSGAEVEIRTDLPSAAAVEPKRRPILIGAYATKHFGPALKSFAYKQGFRVVVNEEAIGLDGESDLAVSYAVYEVLDRLGCRWFLPSDVGEHVPMLKTVALPVMDYSGHPYTYYRSIWYADEDYKRRNRTGGLELRCNHALENRWITDKDRAAHPEWRATVDGKPSPRPNRLKWSAPGLAEAIADTIIAAHETDPQATYSLSPDDGMGYDNSPADRALDTDDLDVSIGSISLTDRLLNLCNRIAQRVNDRHPDVRFGMLAYVPYSRPPKREKVHPSIVPQIAPITFSRSHPMTDVGEPNNENLRYLVDGWGKAAPATSYYFYGYFLAEVSAPNPMIRKWSIDIPYVYEHGKCRYWQPETMPNFETSGQAIYLGLRMAWDPTQKPDEITAEFSRKLYGSMAEPMAAYWDHVDRTWHDVPEYSGGGFGHMRRWSPQRLATARELLEKAKAAAKTERERVLAGMYEESLRLFEQYMQMRQDLAQGQFGTLPEKVKVYLDDMAAAVEKYRPQHAFGGAKWGGRSGINGRYFATFFQPTYEDAGRIANDFQILTPAIRNWRWLQDTDLAGEAAGYPKSDFDDAAWKSTDVMVDTWSALGLHNYLGALWYRQTVDVPSVPADKKVFLWLGATDGSTRVFVNGRHVPYNKLVLDVKGIATGQAEVVQEAKGFCTPFSFDITAALKPGTNQISIRTTRTAVNEYGVGGLLAAPVIYRER